VHAKNGVPVPQQPTPPADPPEGEAAELAALVALFPPPETMRALRASFERFDALFRYVPASVVRRAALLPHGAEREDGPLLALLAAMCLVGALTEQGPAAGLRRLTDGLLRHCTTYGPHDIDYAHAAVVASAAELMGPSSSPARAWVAVGTARAACMLARAHEDRNESLWDRERRRRIWYHLYVTQS
jgi:hypothetical protein